MALSSGIQESPEADLDHLQERPTVCLHDILLGTCFWNVTDMNMEILRSDLTGMTLDAQKKVDDLTKYSVSTDQSLPLINFMNSTVKHFTGTSIHLSMFHSSISVNTQDITTPLVVTTSSTTEIYNCSFQGINYTGNMVLKESAIDTALIFHVKDNSTIRMRGCLIENIRVDLGCDVSAVLYAQNSQVSIYNSILTRNTAKWGVIMAITSDVVINESTFSQNAGKP